MANKRSVTRTIPPAVQAWRWMSVLHARIIDQLETDSLAAGVVPFSWFEVLTALEAAPENRVRLKELVDAVLLTKAGVSRLLDRIEAGGLLRRQACAGDGRGSDAVLTQAGVTALRLARPVYVKTIERHFGQHLTTTQTDAITRLFREILAANDWLPDVRPVPVTIGKRGVAAPSA
jgi:DNA-binding MarR family transcriptional regulator